MTRQMVAEMGVKEAQEMERASAQLAAGLQGMQSRKQLAAMAETQQAVDLHQAVHI